MKSLRLFVPLVVLTFLPGAVLVACGGGGGEATPAPIATKPSGGGGSTGGAGGTSGGGAAKTIEVVMKDNFFEPKEITVPVNTTIKFVAKNAGAAVHNMHILSAAKEGKDFKSDLLVNPGQTSQFEAKFTKTGKYDFQCDYHLPDMVGVVTVTD